MDFFEAQERARRRTKWLLLYFLLAVSGVVTAVYLLVLLVVAMTTKRPVPLWDLEIFVPAALGTVVVILGGSAFKAMQLRAGGAAVAAGLGGRLLDPGTPDVRERRLLNVVEEMAIASGVPVPQVYLLDDEIGINAFAAGTAPGDAVIGMTRGCLDRLTRAELQGVVGHEFSHILNGDMRLNMRLLGWIFGILVLMVIGRTVLYSLRHVRVRSSGSSRGGGGAAVLVVVVIGLGLMAVGWIGVLFARLIQAAVSRQREFLADASAVQFTREPEGLAGALKKIGGLQTKGRLSHPKALEARHMFFAEGGLLTWGFATHPPLEARIRAVQKDWDGRFAKSRLPEVDPGRRTGPPPLRRTPAAAMAGLAALDRLGQSSAMRLDFGQRLRHELDLRWQRAAQDRDGAQALIFGLLLAEDDALRGGQVDHLARTAGNAAARAAEEDRAALAALHSASKIALIDLCVPTLRRMSRPEYERFAEVSTWLVRSDREIDLFEYMLQRLIGRHLAAHFDPRHVRRVRYRRMRELGHEADVICSAVARLGRDDVAAEEAFQMVRNEWGQSGGWSPRLLGPPECGLPQVDEALGKFDAAAPMVKKQLLRACGLAASHDGLLGSGEAELLRAIADGIGAGIPPFVYDLEDGRG